MHKYVYTDKTLTLNFNWHYLDMFRLVSPLELHCSAVYLSHAILEVLLLKSVKSLTFIREK